MPRVLNAAAELALGVLTGRERAQALAHLDHCASCREKVRQLTATGEGLLGLLPSVEPPAGFEARVMDRLGLAAPAPSPSPASQASWISRISHPGRKPARRSATGQAQAGQANSAGAGPRGRRAGSRRGRPGRVGPAFRHLGSSRDPAELRHPALRQPPGSGKNLSYESSSRWLYMSVYLPAGNGTVICEVQSRNSHITTVGSFRLTDGHGYWGSPVPATQGPLTGARLVGPGGTVLATATFHSA